MKGVILAGGLGTRLLPLTKALNKHLLPIGGRLMIEWPVRLMRLCGITELLVVIGGHHAEVITSTLGDGSEYGLRILYAVQPRPAGIADALKQAEGFAGGHQVFVLLGDNFFSDQFAKMFRDVSLQWPPDQAVIFTTKTDRPEAYGIWCDREECDHPRIVEKPKQWTGEAWCVTGAYVLPFDAFSVANSLKPSARDELEITDVNNWFIAKSRMACVKLPEIVAWHDCGESLEQYHAVHKFVLRNGG